jgi:hypothetical protein
MVQTVDGKFSARIGLLVSMALLLAVLVTGCERPDFLDEELPNDGPPIRTSPDAARRFVEKVTAAGERAAETKSLTLVVSQEEVTSFLDLGGMLADQMQALNVGSLAELQRVSDAPELKGLGDLQRWQDLLQGRDGLPNLSLSDLSLRVVLREPQVYFKGNGQIIARGYAEALGQRQPVRLVFAPRAAGGELVLDFVEGNLGPVTVPEVLVDQVGSGLARAILAGQAYVEVTRIEVADGSLTLSGRYAQ